MIRSFIIANYYISQEKKPVGVPGSMCRNKRGRVLWSHVCPLPPVFESQRNHLILSRDRRFRTTESAAALVEPILWSCDPTGFRPARWGGGGECRMQARIVQQGNYQARSQTRNA